MAGLKVVPIKALANGNLDLEDLKAKAEQHKDNQQLSWFVHPYVSPHRTPNHHEIDYLPFYLRCLRGWYPRCQHNLHCIHGHPRSNLFNRIRPAKLFTITVVRFTWMASQLIIVALLPTHALPRRQSKCSNRTHEPCYMRWRCLPHEFTQNLCHVRACPLSFIDHRTY